MCSKPLLLYRAWSDTFRPPPHPSNSNLQSQNSLKSSTVFSCISCCTVPLCWTSSAVSFALSLSSFFLFHLVLPLFFSYQSHLLITLPTLISTSACLFPSLFPYRHPSHITPNSLMLECSVYWIVIRVCPLSYVFEYWTKSWAGEMVRGGGVGGSATKDGWRGSETWLTRQMVINDSQTCDGWKHMTGNRTNQKR